MKGGAKLPLLGKCMDGHNVTHTLPHGSAPRQVLRLRAHEGTGSLDLRHSAARPFRLISK